MNGLRELVVVTHQLAQRVFHLLDQFGFGQARIGPFIARLEHHVTVRDVRRHRVGGDFGRTDAGKRDFDLRKLADALFQLSLELKRLAQACARDPQGLDGDITFIELRHKFRPQRGGKPATGHHEHRRSGHQRPAQLQCASQQRLIGPLGSANQQALALCNWPAHE